MHIHMQPHVTSWATLSARIENTHRADLFVGPAAMKPVADEGAIYHVPPPHPPSCVPQEGED